MGGILCTNKRYLSYAPSDDLNFSVQKPATRRRMEPANREAYTTDVISVTSNGGREYAMTMSYSEDSYGAKGEASSHHTETKGNFNNQTNETNRNHSTMPHSTNPNNPNPGPTPSPSNSARNREIRWRKGELIGAGAYGRVYMGMDLDSGELIAVKQVLVPINTTTKEKAQEHILGLQAEVEVLKNLSHPNIVRYLGTCREEEVLNIFLEFVPGGSIASLLEKFGSFTENVIRMYTKQLLEGLEYLHRNQIMHRDIKGANILVDNHGCIKLADFGASRKLADLATISAGYKSIKGTPYWMAPEIIKQTGHGRQADIWSVGCTVIEMATGKPPWSEFQHQVSALYHIASTNSPPTIPSHLSPEAHHFLLQCFQRNPKQRPTASQLLNHPFLLSVEKSNSQNDSAYSSAVVTSTHSFSKEDPENSNDDCIPRGYCSKEDIGSSIAQWTDKYSSRELRSEKQNLLRSKSEKSKKLLSQNSEFFQKNTYENPSGVDSMKSEFENSFDTGKIAETNRAYNRGESGGISKSFSYPRMYDSNCSDSGYNSTSNLNESVSFENNRNYYNQEYSDYSYTHSDFNPMTEPSFMDDDDDFNDDNDKSLRKKLKNYDGSGYYSEEEISKPTMNGHTTSMSNQSSSQFYRKHLHNHATHPNQSRMHESDVDDPRRKYSKRRNGNRVLGYKDAKTENESESSHRQYANDRMDYDEEYDEEVMNEHNDSANNYDQRNSVLSEDRFNGNVTEHKIKLFLEQKANELKQLQTPLYQEYMSSLRMTKDSNNNSKGGFGFFSDSQSRVESSEMINSSNNHHYDHVNSEYMDRSLKKQQWEEELQMELATKREEKKRSKSQRG